MRSSLESGCLIALLGPFHHFYCPMLRPLLKSLCRLRGLLGFLTLLGPAHLALAKFEVEEDSSFGFFERMGTLPPATMQLNRTPLALDYVAQSKAEKAAEGPADRIGQQVAQLLGPELANANAADPVETEVLPAADEQLLESALRIYHGMDYQAAIAAFVKVLNFVELRPEVEKKALIYIARIYYQLDMPLRTIALLELYADSYPSDPRREEVIFQTGMIHREMGQFEPAIAAFYRVLNAIIMAGEGGIDAYLKLARMAQFEIARTRFALGQWAQAIDLFNRIDLLELGAEDRETLRFYRAKSLVYVGERGKGLRAIDRFIAEYPNSSFNPELHYEKARAQISMKQMDQGRQTLTDLLEMGGVPQQNMTSEWVEWRRMSGNFLANYYFECGEYEPALQLYQALVVMDQAPQWQLPIVLQMASCFRELNRHQRAVESFEFVVQEIDLMRENSGVDALGAEFEFLADSAAWQLGLLKWYDGIAQRVADDA